MTLYVKKTNVQSSASRRFLFYYIRLKTLHINRATAVLLNSGYEFAMAASNVKPPLDTGQVTSEYIFKYPEITGYFAGAEGACHVEFLDTAMPARCVGLGNLIVVRTALNEQQAAIAALHQAITILARVVATPAGPTVIAMQCVHSGRSFSENSVTRPSRSFGGSP